MVNEWIHNEPDVLSNQKTDLGSRGDVELLVLRLHGISSGLQHSSVIISLSVIVYVPQNASSFARMCHKCEIIFTVRQFHRVRKIQNILIVGDSGNRATDVKHLD